MYSVCGCLQGQKEGVRSLKDGITGICELPNMCSGIQTLVLMIEQQVF